MTPGEAIRSQKKRTPGEWRIREFPGREDQFFITAEPYVGHPYFGVTTTIEVMSDEDYPTKRADAEFIVHAVNNFDDLLAALKVEEALAQRVTPPPFGHTCKWCSDCVAKVTQMRRDAIAKAEAKP